MDFAPDCILQDNDEQHKEDISEDILLDEYFIKLFLTPEDIINSEMKENKFYSNNSKEFPKNGQILCGKC